MLTEQVDAEWLKGRIGGNEGMFPSNFLDIVEPLPKKSSSGHSAPTKPARTSVSDTVDSVAGLGPRCLARFDYDGEDQDDLQFKSGDVIT